MKYYYLFLVVVFSLLFACKQKKESIVIMNEEIKQQKNRTLFYQKEIDHLKKDMNEYRKLTHDPYPESAVNQVEEILNQYFEKMEYSTSKKEGIAIIKDTVEQLNALNEKWDIISTDGRELIVDIILEVGEARGYTEKEVDITEEWREW